MKKLLLIILLLCSISFSQIGYREDETDNLAPLFRVAIPATTTIIAYKAFKGDGMEFEEQVYLLATSILISAVSAFAYEIADGRDFKGRNIGQYSMGMFTGTGIVLLFEF